MAGRRLLAPGDVAAWLLKTSVHPGDLLPGWAPGQGRTLERCVVGSYRLALMRHGQVCVLWLSGSVAPGVHALGHVVQEPALTGWSDTKPSVTVSLRLLAEPVARAELRDCPAFADAEVLRMPAGSNPSYLTGPQHAAVLELAGDSTGRPTG